MLRSAFCRLPFLGLGLGCFSALTTLAHAEEPTQPAAETKLSLDAAIRLALEKNFVIKVDAFGPAIARAGVTEAYGRYDPLLKGSRQESRSENPQLADSLTGLRPSADVTKTYDTTLAIEGFLPLGTSYQIGGSTTNQPSTSNNYTSTYTTFAGVTATQPLLRDFGLNPGLYQIRLARTNLAISEWDYRLSVTNVITQVIYAYSDLHLAQAYLKSATRSRDMTVQLYNENEGRRKRGAMSEYDVLSARARVANREETLLEAERGVHVAQNALKQLVSDGHNPAFFNWHLAIEPLPAASTETIDPAKGFREALAQRPDYRSACLGVRKNDLDRRYLRNQLLPRVDLNGSYGYNGIGADAAHSRTDVRNQDYAAYSTGVSVSVPLTSATERGRARAASLRLRQSEADLQRLEQDILIEVSNAAQQVESTRKRVVTTRTARDLNDEMLQAEMKRLRAGTGSTFNVLYQQDQFSYAEIAAAQAEADHRKALAEYDRQTGHTLDALHITLRTD
jgi:outer membrane protein TolC